MEFPTARRLASRSRRAVRRLHREAIRLLHPRGFHGRPMGVNLVGSLGEHSIAVMTRDYAAALRSAGIPVTEHDIINQTAGWQRRLARNFGRIQRHAFTIIVNPPLFFRIDQLPVSITAGRFVIANWLWEQSELPQAYLDSSAQIDEFWASSEFVRSTYLRSIDKPITLIAHPVRQVETSPTVAGRARFDLPTDRYVFLTIASATSSFVRKNPLGSMHAFRAAFPHGQTEAVLAIKLLVSDFSPTPTAQREYFSSDPTFGDDIILIIEAISDSEMTELLKCCDAFVSLHRAEGFGLGAAESMSLGKPVIVTNWSGPVDFLTAENSLPVPYELVTIDDTGTIFYKPGLEWAEPDLDVATGYMKALVDDPSLGEMLGRQAALDIAGRHSIPVVGATMAARLKQLHRS